MKPNAKTIKLNSKAVIWTAVTGAVGLMLLTILGVIYAMNGCGENLNDTAAQVAAETIEAITRDWVPEEMEKRVPPAFLEQGGSGRIRALLLSYKMNFGKVIEIGKCEGRAHAAFDPRYGFYATAILATRLQCEKGDVFATVRLVKNLSIHRANSPWMMSSFSFEPYSAIPMF
jgi:hypothetical protein